MVHDRESAFNKRKMSIKEYRKRKLKMLKRDFCIHLTDEEIDHANTLDKEIAIDQFCISMINKYVKTY